MGLRALPNNKHNMRMGIPDDDGDSIDFGGGDAPWKHRAQAIGNAPCIKEAGSIEAAVFLSGLPSGHGKRHSVRRYAQRQVGMA